MKPLTAEELKQFVQIDEPIKMGRERLTKHVVVIYYGGKVVGIDTITGWRRLRGLLEPDKYVYELRNMWI